jgi:hypothetical protein
MDDGTSRRRRSKRTQLLDDLAEQYQSVKRTRFERVVAGLLEDVDSDSLDAMSLSDISGVSGIPANFIPNKMPQIRMNLLHSRT